ncbi:MAG: hypothetical protein KQJ78_20260 [Deltaproteobacteria bacterium]|nr:hypothetical protein [Deltaproteobacteria bacterium]
MAMTADSSTTANVFEVKDCALAAIAIGERAHDLRELADLISTIGVQSLYYHFWGGLLRPRFDDPEYHNDFAIWSSRSLRDPVLAEKLGVLDPTHFADLERLRGKLLQVLRDHMAEYEHFSQVAASDPFLFVRSQIVVFDSGRRLKTPEDLRDAILTLSAGSIFYHFIDARRREPMGQDDFSVWLGGSFPETWALCVDLRKLDPFFWGLGSLRVHLSEIMHLHLPGIS